MTSAAALTLLAPAAFAQTTNSGAAADQSDNAATAPNGHPANVRAQLMSNLRQAGFTDVRIMPEAFLVRAKDPSGNPVTMFINPTSMEMVTRETVSNSRTNMAANDDTTTQATGNATATAPVNGSDEFTNIPASEELSSKVVGLEVYNNANQDIGKIKDVAFDQNGVRAYIVAVGGFLGMGDHYVAVKPSAIDISYNSNDKKWHAAMNTDASQLKAAPEYKYSSNE
jgi:sporulation protein YlmC with PRC-barrel domain